MLAIEKEKLKLVKKEIKSLGQTTLDINEQILVALEHCRPCKLRDIKKYPNSNAIKKLMPLII